MLLIVFYDSECGLCDRAVVFLKRVDKKSLLNFETLRSSLAAKHVPEEIRQAMDTVVYFREKSPCFYVGCSSSSSHRYKVNM